MNGPDLFGPEEIVAIARNGKMHELDVGHYPDWFPFVKTFRSCATLLVRPSSLDAFMTAMFYVDALAARGLETPTLLLPCVPGQRQDRVTESGDFLFAAKSIAREINQRQFPEVVIVDPHSDVIAACIDRCSVLPAGYWFERREFRAEYDGVIAPDAGAGKRALMIAGLLGCKVLHAGKMRDVETGDLLNFWLQGAKRGEHYLVIDDLCDAGGTFLGLHELIAASGATADLCVTHGLFTKGTEALCEAYGTVYCTDSVPGEKPGVVVIPLCRTLIEDFG